MKPVWLFFSNGEICGADFLMERDLFFFDPVFGSFDTTEALFRIDIEVEGKIGLEVLAGKEGKFTDPFKIKTACSALVGNGGIVKAVTENNFPSFEGGQDHLLDVLGPIGKEEKEFSARGDIFFVVMQKEMADEIACHGAARGAC
jgi:hypothetical protein